MSVPTELRQIVWKYCTIDDLIGVGNTWSIRKKKIYHFINLHLKNTQFLDDNHCGIVNNKFSSFIVIHNPTNGYDKNYTKYISVQKPKLDFFTLSRHFVDSSISNTRVWLDDYSYIFTLIPNLDFQKVEIHFDLSLGSTFGSKLIKID